MADAVEVDERSLEKITLPDRIQYLLKSYLRGRVLYQKGTEPPAEVMLVDFDESNRVTLRSTSVRYQVGEDVYLFRILGRYIHLRCQIDEKQDNNSYRATVLYAAIASKDRKETRIPVEENEIYINHIRTSKNTIDIHRFNIPTLVKVNFSNFQKKLEREFDVVLVDGYMGHGDVFDAVRKSNKPLLVPHAPDPKSYQPLNENFFDYAAYLGEDINDKIYEYNNQRIVSELILPISYFTHDQNQIPIGFLQIQSRTIDLNEEHVRELQSQAEQMVSRIRESNTVVISEKQQVINLSRGGLKIKIKNPELRNYLEHQSGFTFGLYFRGQSVITLYGLIRSAVKTENDELIMGVQITGRSAGRDDMRRFVENIDLHERAYKESVERQKTRERKH